jgi:hypothetical protein
MIIDMKNALKQVHKLLLIVAVAVIYCLQPVYAQQDKWSEKGEIEDTQVVIEKDRRIELPVANRKFEKVPPITLMNVRPVYDLKPIELSLKLPEIEPRLRVLTMKPEPIEKIYSNYAKVGGGNFGHRYLEGMINNKRDENYSYGAHILDQDFLNGPVDGRNSGAGQQNVNVFARSVNNKYASYLTGGYQRNRIHFYGYDPNTQAEINAADIRKIYNNFNIDAGIQNNDMKAELDYALDAKVNFFSDSDNQSESDYKIHGRLSYKLADDWRTGIRISTHFTKLSIVTLEHQRNLITATPYVNYKLNKLSIDGELQFIYQTDSLNAGEDNLFVLPGIIASYPLSNQIQVQGGFRGEVERVTFRDLIYENPFLDIAPVLGNTVAPFVLFAQLQGVIFNGLAFKAGASIGRYRNMYFFNFSGDAFDPSATDPAAMRVAYDRGNLNMAKFYAEVDYSPVSRVTSNLKAAYYIYNMDELATPYHRPAFEISHTSRYNIYDKFVVKNNFWLMGGIIAEDPFSPLLETKTLEPIVRWDIGVEYLLDNRVNIFLDFNNLLNQNYERWIYYQARGLHFRLGLSYYF